MQLFLFSDNCSFASAVKLWSCFKDNDQSWLYWAELYPSTRLETLHDIKSTKMFHWAFLFSNCCLICYMDFSLFPVWSSHLITSILLVNNAKRIIKNSVNIVLNGFDTIFWVMEYLHHNGS